MIDDGADTHTCRRQVSEHARTRTCRRRERVRTVLKPSALAHTLTPSERPHTTAVFCLFYLHLTATISLALVFYEAKTKITSIEIYLQHATTIMCHCRHVTPFDRSHRVRRSRSHRRRPASSLLRSLRFHSCCRRSVAVRQPYHTQK